MKKQSVRVLNLFNMCLDTCWNKVCVPQQYYQVTSP